MFKNIFNIKHKKFNIETYNNILEECKTKKWVTNISDLKDIDLYGITQAFDPADFV